RDGLSEDHLAVGVANADDRRVSARAEEDLRSPDLQRMVHPNLAGLCRRIGILLVRHLADEPGRCRGRQIVVRDEPIKPERERWQRRCVEQPPGVEAVELRDRVGEALPFDDEHAGSVAKQLAHCEGDEQQNQGDMEKQVAQLAEAALLRADRGGGRPRARRCYGGGGAGSAGWVLPRGTVRHPEAPITQNLASGGVDLARCRCGGPAAVYGEPVEVPWRSRWAGSGRQEVRGYAAG